MELAAVLQCAADTCKTLYLYTAKQESKGIDGCLIKFHYCCVLWIEGCVVKLVDGRPDLRWKMG